MRVRRYGQAAILLVPLIFMLLGFSGGLEETFRPQSSVSASTQNRFLMVCGKVVIFVSKFKDFQLIKNALQTDLPTKTYNFLANFLERP